MLRIIFLKLIISFTIFLFASCSSEDDSSSTESAFAPPTWIQAAWVDNVSNTDWKSGFKFDSTDVYVIMFGQVIETGYFSAGVVTEHLTSTDSEFSYSAPVSGTSGTTSYSGTVTYVFTKESSTSLTLSGTSTTSYVSVTETTYTKDTSL